MRHFHLISFAVMLLLLLMLAACGSGEEAGESENGEVNFEDLEEFDPNAFDNPTSIDNQWLPYQPGSQWIFEGVTVEDGESIPHRLEFTVTDLTKEIYGIPTVVIWAEDFADGELVEAEIAFYAQDNAGNVWHMGEYPEEYEEGEFVEAPAWISGVADALPGIAMKANPQKGEPSYSQGWGPAVGWTDRGQVYEIGQENCVPVDCYENVLIIDEFSQEEPNAFQQKYYAPGVGGIRVGFRGDDPTQEELELVELNQLDAAGLAAVREKALALEAHAYEVSPDVYGTTAPAE